MEYERYAVVDVETTGFSPARDRIVEVACALVDGERVIGAWSTLVDPGMAIPPRATAVHGITDDMCAGAPAIGPALEALRERCAGRSLAAHCAGFDVSFLGPAIGTRAICTLRLARALFPEAPDHKNQTLRRFLGLDALMHCDVRAHRALDDALVTAHLLVACRRRFRERYPGASWERFLQARVTIAREPALVA